MDFIKHRKMAEQIEAELYPLLKGGKRQSKYILCIGLQGYRWCAVYCSRNSTPNRVGRFEKLSHIIEDSINEYTAVSNESADTLTFTVKQFSDIEKIFDGISKTAWGGYNSKFFDKVK